MTVRSRSRTCIFCGKTPEDKTKEHILPQWLIQHTGDPKRVVGHGADYAIGRGSPKLKRFAFDQFVFPACNNCNNKWSSFEQHIKSVIVSIENESAITESDVNDLFDWFDKVRVGLWLSRIIDRSTIAQVDPKFYIDQRIGAFDRLLYVSRGSASSGLTTIGIGSPVFAIMPSVFALKINDLMFFNASAIGLFSHRLGFPRIVDRRVFMDGKMNYTADILLGTGLVKTPVMFRKYPLPALRLYQPMYRYLNVHHLWQDHFQTDYVLVNSREWSVGEGKIFVERGSAVQILDNFGADEYANMNVNYGSNLADKVQVAVSSWQDGLSRCGLKGDIMTSEQKAEYAETGRTARKLNRMLSRMPKKKKPMKTG